MPSPSPRPIRLFRADRRRCAPRRHRALASPRFEVRIDCGDPMIQRESTWAVRSMDGCRSAGDDVLVPAGSAGGFGTARHRRALGRIARNVILTRTWLSATAKEERAATATRPFAKVGGGSLSDHLPPQNLEAERSRAGRHPAGQRRPSRHRPVPHAPRTSTATPTRSSTARSATCTTWARRSTPSRWPTS